MAWLLFLAHLFSQPVHVGPPPLLAPPPPLPRVVRPPSTTPEIGGVDLNSMVTEVDLGDDGRTVSATVVITLTANESLGTALYLLVDEGLSFHTVDGTAYSPTVSEQAYPPFNYGTLSFQTPVPAGETVTVTIGFSGVLQCNPYGARESRYCGGDGSTSFYQAGGLFAMVMDYKDPYGTLVYERHLTFHTPAALDLLPSADFVSEEVNGDRKTTVYHAAPFTSGMNMILLTGSFESIEVEGTTPPAKVYYPAGSREWAQEMADWTAPIFQWLTAQSGDSFPFGAVNIFKLPPLDGFPGTATYGMVYLAESYSLRGPEWFEEILAHEISHLWWGILASPSDLYSCNLMVEGMAIQSQYDYIYDTYYSAQDRTGWLGEKYKNGKLLLWYITDPETLPDIMLPEGQQWPSTVNEQVVWAYYKTSSTLDHLRVLMGESRYEEGLRAYAQECVPQVCDTLDVQRIMEGAAGEDLTWFFEQFVFDSNYPVITAGFEPGEGEVMVTLGQEGTLTLEMELWLYLDDGTVQAERVRLASGEEHFTFTTPAPVLSVGLNPRLSTLYRFASSLPGDVNLDGEVDGFDLIAVALGVGSEAVTSDQPNIYDIDMSFPVELDRNYDGVIDDNEITAVTTGFGVVRGGAQ